MKFLRRLFLRPKTIAVDPRWPWSICDRHGFSTPPADLRACPDCYVSPNILEALER